MWGCVEWEIGSNGLHDDVIKWKHFPRYWPFVWGIHRSPVNSPHKGQWRGALMFSLICAWINRCVNNREAGDLRCYRAYHDVIVMASSLIEAEGHICAYVNQHWYGTENGVSPIRSLIHGCPIVKWTTWKRRKWVVNQNTVITIQ